MKKAKINARLYPKDRFPPKQKDLPATQGMLWLVRTELKEEMTAGFHRMTSVMEKMSSEISQLRSEIKSDVGQLRSETRSDLAEVKSEVTGVKSEVARLGVLIEEQRADNRIVLEALTGHAQRQDRMERRVDEVENIFCSLAKIKR